MTPDSFANFFFACAGVSGALIGLLFVASSLAPDRTIAADAPARAQESAASAFLVLSNTLFVALAALIPSYSLGNMVMIVAFFGLMGTVIFAVRTFVHQRLESAGLGFRWYLQRVAIVVLFAYQFYLGVQMVLNPSDESYYGSIAILSLIFYAIGVGRAWDLLGGRGHDISEALRMVREERHHAQVRRQGDAGDNKG